MHHRHAFGFSRRTRSVDQVSEVLRSRDALRILAAEVRAAPPVLVEKKRDRLKVGENVTQLRLGQQNRGVRILQHELQAVRAGKRDRVADRPHPLSTPRGRLSPCQTTVRRKGRRRIRANALRTQDVGPARSRENSIRGTREFRSRTLTPAPQASARPAPRRADARRRWRARALRSRSNPAKVARVQREYSRL